MTKNTARYCVRWQFLSGNYFNKVCATIRHLSVPVSTALSSPVDLTRPNKITIQGNMFQTATGQGVGLSRAQQFFICVEL